MRKSQMKVVTILAMALLAIATPLAGAQTYTILHDFTDSPDGAVPNPLIRDAQGNFYGTTAYGGLASCGKGTCGTVFKIDNAGHETVLYRFTGGDNGTNPVAGLVRDAKGNLYGTTQGNGFIGGQSVIFKVDPKGQQTVLYIADTQQASSLDSPLALDAQGNLYGMSPYGGDQSCSVDGGCGTLFKLTPSGKFKVLHVFKGKDGIQPEGGVVLDAQGNIYGTASTGGKLSCDYPGWGQNFETGCGTIYKLDRSGKFTILHTFTGPVDGSDPLGLTIDSAGNLYGIAGSGGDIAGNYIYGLGTVFEVDTSGKFSVLFTFTPETTLNYVYAKHLLKDSKGNLYGVQEYNNCEHAAGCLFRIDTEGKYTDLYDFDSQQSGGGFFFSMGLILGSDGSFYGNTPVGGNNNGRGDCTQNCGTVFHLALSAEPNAALDTP
jgi:uncharacterized repeat protein (TIGR03803 family)